MDEENQYQTKDVELIELQKELNRLTVETRNLYYSSDALVERIKKRNFWDLVKAKIYQAQCYIAAIAIEKIATDE